MVPASLSAIYPDHVSKQFNLTRDLLEQYGYQRLVIGAGELQYHYRDDTHAPFKLNPYFAVWAPLEQADEGLIVIDLDTDKPQMWLHCPPDIWHGQKQLRCDDIQQRFEVSIFEDQRQMHRTLFNTDAKTAYIGPDLAFFKDQTTLDINPVPLLTALDYHRAWKTPYEQGCIRLANELAVRGHRAAAEVFRNRGSEYQAHLAYLQATEQLDEQLPYGNIVAFNEHCAVLHYTQRERIAPSEHRSFLIDAGAEAAGYAADITRTYVGKNNTQADNQFAALIHSMDQLQLDIISRIEPGVSYVDLHLQTHRNLAAVLKSAELICCDEEEAIETGVTRVFLPHGLGHYLGVQVHDRGGYLADPAGDEELPPNEHPFLRLTRRIDEHQVFTIEPGLYFIPPLLEAARNDHRGQSIQWQNVEPLLPYGGIRIEDNILVTASGCVNFTRTNGL
jgi:Xaa-Pro dipeptidase